MFRIRQIADVDSPRNQAEIAEVQRILETRLPGLSAEEIRDLPGKIRDPLGHRFRALLFVADELRGQRLRGFALLSHAPDENFAFLDYIAAGERETGGVGAALYGHVRDCARAMGVIGLFFECLPDDPAGCSDPTFAAANAARLRFYERFGARPIVGTDYERPLSPGDRDMPHLVFDDLDTGRPLDREEGRRVVRAILERKYARLCPPDYVEAVVSSMTDDPIRIREPRYRGSKPARRSADLRLEDRIVLVVNEKHDIHHVRERGYVESPARVRSILKGLENSGLCHRVEARRWPEAIIRRIHAPELVDYLARACARLPEGKSIYPYVFPLRNKTRPPKDLGYAAGYFCLDTFTPLNANAYKAARAAVDCALTAAEVVRDGQRFAYALVRPPGHHAERRVFGGFCYFNNAAAAAELLSEQGRVAILDLDYHHGNGQQDIFWHRPDVLTISIHGEPAIAYPFFSGFADECGGPGAEGSNRNFPLPEKVDGKTWRKSLVEALELVRSFRPRHLVVALGLDTAKADPTGSWSLGPEDFEANGRLVGALGLPTVVVQEGGYRTASLGQNARRFFRGLVTGDEKS
ncbi:MAG: histone deacetylase family protein [Planctomycetes bacterium]|nr:histone deacetylase family protein [Planctomycetota bacterium]